ncbi:MAG: sigma-70 family RNA polymerase sigma factor [Planctomycetes bacterium]|nr:sigma-70 family RNA polymerase sigma factor [Planctomycetota bacterium]
MRRRAIFYRSPVDTALDEAMNQQSPEFIKLLTDAQSMLYAYIASLVGSSELANEVLQNTNLVLWSKAEEFAMGTRFASWALGIAHFEVLTARKKLARDRHVFSPALIDKLAEESGTTAQASGERQRALEQCLAKLPAAQRKIVQSHYADQQTANDIARAMGRKAPAVRQMLHRIRLALTECVDRELSTTGQS